MDKIRRKGIPLQEFAGVTPSYGIKTGFNKAFLIDTETKQHLVDADPKCSEVIKPHLRGRNINRWFPEWTDEWLIFSRRGIDIDSYPVIRDYLAQFRQQLEPKPKNWQGRRWPGRKRGSYEWYEIQDAVDYWEYFEKPKIMYQVIQFHSAYALDLNGYYANDKCFIIPSYDLYLLAVLNSPMMWWHNTRYLGHMKDEALNPSGVKMVDLPIAVPNDQIRQNVEERVQIQLDLSKTLQEHIQDMLHWLKIEFGVEKPGNKIQDFATISEDDFISEVKKRGTERLTPASLRLLREQFTEYSQTIRTLVSDRTKIEHELSDLINQAYQLTPEEIDLLWRTAPPRMPINPPNSST